MSVDRFYLTNKPFWSDTPNKQVLLEDSTHSSNNSMTLLLEIFSGSVEYLLKILHHGKCSLSKKGLFFANNPKSLKTKTSEWDGWALWNMLNGSNVWMFLDAMWDPEVEMASWLRVDFEEVKDGQVSWQALVRAVGGKSKGNVLDSESKINVFFNCQ